jgi:hypothetical protein
MITICIPSRKSKNLSSNLKNFLDSLDLNTSDDEKLNVEVILKFDSDDSIPDFILYKQYSFDIKYTQYPRGSGRHEINNFINYMSEMRNDRSRFIMNMADDFVIKRPFISNLLKCEESYKIFGGMTRGRGEQRGGDSDIYRDDFIQLPIGANFRDYNSWSQAIAHYCPIISTKLLEVMGHFTIIPTADAYIMCVAMCLFKDYGVNIWSDIESFYYRNECKEYFLLGSESPEYLKEVSPYNMLDIFIMKGNGFEGKFYKKVEQTSLNIYLNMKKENII